jgi:hypothetical protein
MAHQRGLTTRRPRPAHRRDEHEATLIQEYQVRSQSPGFFLMAAHL